MANIYANAQGQQVYDYNGQTFDAKTGQPLQAPTQASTAGPNVNANPNASGTLGSFGPYQAPTTSTPTPALATPTQTQQAPTSTYTPPPAPTIQNTADQYLQNYLSSLNPTTEETALKGQYDAINSQIGNVTASRDLGIQGVNEQPIATKFLTGESAAITNRAAVQAEALGAQATPLKDRLAAEQARRQSAMDVNKEALTYAENKDTSANNFNQQQYQNQVNAQKASSDANKSSFTEVNPGNTLYNTTTGQVAYTAPAAGGTTTTPNGLAQGKTFSSGTLNYSPSMFNDDKNQLIASRGADGYVNPSIYVSLYKAWVANGGVTSDFLQVYPVKDYVNPAPQSDPAIYSVIKQLRGDKAPVTKTTTTAARSI